MEIRKYIPSDKPRLRYICKETAGGIFKHSEKTLEAAAIIYNDYFTENENDNIFVLADDNDNAVGYIICSSDYSKFMKLNSSVYLKRVIKASPVLSSALIGYMLCLKCIKNKSVHLHMDILPEYQRKGWGTKLIDELCVRLKSKGINTLSVCCVSRSSAGYKMYTKYGFKEIFSYGFNTVSLSLTI